MQESFFVQLEDRNGKSGRAGKKLRTSQIIKKKYALESYLQTEIPAHLERALTQKRI